MVRRHICGVALAATVLTSFGGAPLALASSHQDAPLISLDDPANTTDVYAFVNRRPNSQEKYLTVALAVYPFEEPGVGPNNYRFDPSVTYDIRLALDDSIQNGRTDIVYRFKFEDRFKNPDTILQSFLGVLTPAGRGNFPENQNLRQTYSVTKHPGPARFGETGNILGSGIIVPPNNQGRVTPFYNRQDNGDRQARQGVDRESRLDPYTRQAITSLKRDYRVFAGQRDDGFYADIQSIFDLDFTFGTDSNTPTKPFDSQGGFNLHTIALEIPFSELGGAEIAGVYATTGRGGVQVARQGNPLFNEGLVAVREKDIYSRTLPSDDNRFREYARNPELSRLLGVKPLSPGLLETIFIPDMIKVDLTTRPARLAGEPGFNRLSLFGGDVLKSTAEDNPFNDGGMVPGGWPNGRRFGDDVLDIAIIALGIAGAGPDFSDVNVDGVTQNEITFNDVFPYAATPLNGRVHEHHGETFR